MLTVPTNVSDFFFTLSMYHLSHPLLIYTTLVILMFVGYVNSFNSQRVLMAIKYNAIFTYMIVSYSGMMPNDNGICHHTTMNQRLVS